MPQILKLRTHLNHSFHQSWHWCCDHLRIGRGKWVTDSEELFGGERRYWFANNGDTLMGMDGDRFLFQTWCAWPQQFVCLSKYRETYFLLDLGVLRSKEFLDSTNNHHFQGLAQLLFSSKIVSLHIYINWTKLGLDTTNDQYYQSLAQLLFSSKVMHLRISPNSISLCLP